MKFVFIQGTQHTYLNNGDYLEGKRKIATTFFKFFTVQLLKII